MKISIYLSPNKSIVFKTFMELIEYLKSKEKIYEIMKNEYMIVDEFLGEKIYAYTDLKNYVDFEIADGIYLRIERNSQV